MTLKGVFISITVTGQPGHLESMQLITHTPFQEQFNVKRKFSF